MNDTLSEVVLVPEYFYDGSWRRARVEGDTVFVSFYYRSADTLGSEWRQVVTFSGDSGLLVPGSGYACGYRV